MTDRSARLFGVPPGVDFPAAVAGGVRTLVRPGHPEDFARISLVANTRRMARAIADALAADGPILLPRIETLVDLTEHLPGSETPPLRRQFELTRLVEALISADESAGAHASSFDIAGSLAELIDEMAGEGVAFERLQELDLGGMSEHWHRSLAFLELAGSYLSAAGTKDAGSRQHQAAIAMIARWAADPPKDPVVLAGSTGSRGSTFLLLEAVARLERGFVVLPGFDFDLPEESWDRLHEDHAQFRYGKLLRALGVSPGDVVRWGPSPQSSGRNALLSLALRPAPVTDTWRKEGARIRDLHSALADVSLIEAASSRHEANAIALGMRAAVGAGKSAMLVTPDRKLSRQVTAALQRWGIVPDDSAGQPLALSAPGRLLRQVAGAFSHRLSADAALAILNHPLTASGSSDRGPHLLMVRDLEIWLRRRGAAYLDRRLAQEWSLEDDRRLRAPWVDWAISCLPGPKDGLFELGALTAELIERTARLCAGAHATGAGELWEKAAGAAARLAVDHLLAEAGASGPVTPARFERILVSVLSEEIREPIQARGDVRIRGTMEVRADTADLVILAGLNEGVWPSMPTADPWLNRSLRRQAGLLLPERRIGLSAHDFQIAFGAAEVWLTRSLRDSDSPTVPSRWLNRLTGLVGGLDSANGGAALAKMRKRGEQWLDLGAGVDRRLGEVPPAPRPAPIPPETARPRRIRVTEVQTLIRDPYAVYARNILRLRPLPPLRRRPDAAMRGTVLHRVMERFVRAGIPPDDGEARRCLRETALEVIAREVPWAETRELWSARLMQLADTLIQWEREFAGARARAAFETDGCLELADPPMKLVGKADRIDVLHNGSAVIVDYKSGSLPTQKQIEFFDRQLALEALMVEQGAFAEIGRRPATWVIHIGLGSKAARRDYPVGSGSDRAIDTNQVLAEFRRLMAAYHAPDQAFVARRAMETVQYPGDFDHLSRFGEWDESIPANEEHLK